jgi:hypothetical protein
VRRSVPPSYGPARGVAGTRLVDRRVGAAVDDHEDEGGSAAVSPDGGPGPDGGAGSDDARSERRFEDLDGIAQHDVGDAVLRGRRIDRPELRPAARTLAASHRRGYGTLSAVTGAVTVVALAAALLLPDRTPFWVVFTAVLAGPMAALWSFGLHRSARRAELANRTDDGPVPIPVVDRLAAIPPALFVGLLSTWLLRALVGAVVVGLGVTPHPAVLGVPLTLISLGVAVAAYQRILADWRS